MCNKSAAESFPVAFNAVNAVIFLSAIFSPFKFNVNPPYFRGGCYSRDSRPLALYNYYATTVIVPQAVPCAELIASSAFAGVSLVSLIVELLANTIL